MLHYEGALAAEQGEGAEDEDADSVATSLDDAQKKRRVLPIVRSEETMKNGKEKKEEKTMKHDTHSTCLFFCLFVCVCVCVFVWLPPPLTPPFASLSLSVCLQRLLNNEPVQ